MIEVAATPLYWAHMREWTNEGNGSGCQTKQAISGADIKDSTNAALRYKFQPVFVVEEYVPKEFGHSVFIRE